MAARNDRCTVRHERRGEHKLAYGVWHTIARTGGQHVLANARLNALAPVTRSRVTRLGFAAIGSILLLLCALATLLESITDHGPVQWWLVVLGFGSFVALLVWRRMHMP